MRRTTDCLGPFLEKRAAVLQGTPGGPRQPAGTRALAESADACEKPWRLILWDTAAGAYTSSSEVNEDCIRTVPRAQAKHIMQALSVGTTSRSLPMESHT